SGSSILRVRAARLAISSRTCNATTRAPGARRSALHSSDSGPAARSVAVRRKKFAEGCAPQSGCGICSGSDASNIGGSMKKLSLAAALLAAFGTVHAQTQEELLRDGNGGNTDNVLTYGMGYHQQRYSPLKEINKRNVRRLVPVWSLSLNNEHGEQGQPLV